MKKHWKYTGALASVAIILSACSGGDDSQSGTGDTEDGANGDPVEISYWQYQFDSKVDLMDELIEEFEDANPDITVTQTNFPYDQFNERVATQVPAGEGPDVINLFNGWVPNYVDQGFLQPLPQESFSHEEIENEFFPFIESVKLDDEYWTLPTGVRTLSLFYNVDIFEEYGIDGPPETWDELVDTAVELTERTDNGQLEQSGMAWEPAQQGHHWWRDGLLPQAGGQSLSDDAQTVTWNDTDAGLESFEYYLSFALVHETSERDFYTEDFIAFQTENAAMNIDGSFRLGTLQTEAPDLNYAVAPLPVHEEGGELSSPATFWSNGIVAGVEDEKLDASVKFLEFLTSEDVMERWTEEIGELPARESVAMQEQFADDELFGPFVEQLPYASTHTFVDESTERDLFIAAVDRVLLQDMSPEESLDILTEETQALFDAYWN
ncbi:glycerol-3-phosphate ABC transporter, periplasmic glycerol-3-phosphate-binding protein [Geomicrobium sp. JCM 19037]|uniref:extracellular solute-binding protein n=1 Tax=Geomicrobium sp. JCM 19037 TaxID=1460634 RepID=UPI00045F14AE|nr:extracellular solute-binding protein [Geomicrobium sp. JCM 19037]GAK03707.1 glycerol-3-phosphate ABC transporter, periplasmic glycerol-3-phosphate-binding protein [Geomicrobium sp. JCM 19037]